MQYRRAPRVFSHPYPILSATHDFLRLVDLVPGLYNVTFNDPRTSSISQDALGQRACEMELDRYRRIVVVAGRRYAEMAADVFPGRQVVTPLAGLGGMGLMMQAMNQLIQGGRGIEGGEEPGGPPR